MISICIAVDQFDNTEVKSPEFPALNIVAKIKQQQKKTEKIQFKFMALWK